MHHQAADRVVRADVLGSCLRCPLHITARFDAVDGWADEGALSMAAAWLLSCTSEGRSSKQNDLPNSGERNMMMPSCCPASNRYDDRQYSRHTELAKAGSASTQILSASLLPNLLPNPHQAAAACLAEDAVCLAHQYHWKESATRSKLSHSAAGQ